jgi:hypothetical protein
MNRLLSSRTLLLLGLGIGLISFSGTISHIGDPNYLLVAGIEEGEPIIRTHAWYHALREAAGDVAAMAILLLVFFGPERFRTPQTWLISLLLMVGYYAPFWIGAPFSEGLASPSWEAEIVHIIMAALSGAALVVGRPIFLIDDKRGVPKPMV